MLKGQVIQIFTYAKVLYEIVIILDKKHKCYGGIQQIRWETNYTVKNYKGPLKHFWTTMRYLFVYPPLLKSTNTTYRTKCKQATYCTNYLKENQTKYTNKVNIQTRMAE